MNLSLWFLCFGGAFYLAFGVIVAVRACRPSCRLCVHWQECRLNADLGMAVRRGCLTTAQNR